MPAIIPMIKTQIFFPECRHYKSHSFNVTTKENMQESYESFQKALLNKVQ